MGNQGLNLPGIYALLKPWGLLPLGSLRVSSKDQVPEIAEDRPARQLLLVGNAGSSFWPVFSRSPEYHDGQPNPLDRWSKRAGNDIALSSGSLAVFPFDGPPYQPFLRWAGKSGEAIRSQLSMFIHARYGLWHAYRFALALAAAPDERIAVSEFTSPCIECEQKPCLDACPVEAFSGGAYDVVSCIHFLGAETESACRKQGCASRRACPQGAEFTYLPLHARFHMDAFVEAQL